MAVLSASHPTDERLDAPPRRQQPTGTAVAGLGIATLASLATQGDWIATGDTFGLGPGRDTGLTSRNE